MNTLANGQTNRLLGYPDDAHLLIITADEFGMCHAINEAIFRALRKGVLRSTTLMVPRSWTLHAMHFLADHPEIPFGVHLTVISDWVDYGWGPVTPRDQVPSPMWQGDRFVTRQTTGFAPIKHLSLADPAVTMDLRSESGQLIVELTSRALALLVEVSLTGADVVFSDNYFNLPPGRTVQISCPLPDGWTLDQAERVFCLRSVYDSYTHGVAEGAN